MKQLKTYPNGRMPLWQGDLAFIQEAPKEVLLALINELGLGSTDFIITGCRITYERGSASMTAGWAFFEGEILPVAAITATECNRTPRVSFAKVNHWDGVQKTFDVNGEAVPRNVYQNDFLQGSITPFDPAENVNFGIREEAWTLAERLRHNIALEDSGWVGDGEVQYRKIGNMVQLKGTVFNDAQGGFNNATVASRLPIPAAELTYFPTVEVGTTMLKIDNSGNLIITSSNNRVRFNHIVYMCNTAPIAGDGHLSSNVGTGGDTPGGGNDI